MAVIKANAYGHGAIDVARGLDDADAFAVAFLPEAVELREAGIEKPILVLQGVSDRRSYQVAEQLDLWLVIHSELQAVEAQQIGGNCSCWVKVDTGMSRLGVPVDKLPDVVSRLGSRCQVIMSHFASADDPSSPENAKQIDRFREATDGFGLQRSLSNSAGLLGNREAHFDWVRPGIALYGGNPFCERNKKPNELRPVMQFEAPLVSVNWRAEGVGVGYSGLSRLEKASPVGVVSAGYADGFPRSAPPGTLVSVNGVMCPTLGRVSMDMLCIDLSHARDAQVGDIVELWGGSVCVDALSEAAGTISYELLCQAGNALLMRGAAG